MRFKPPLVAVLAPATEVRIGEVGENSGRPALVLALELCNRGPNPTRVDLAKAVLDVSYPAAPALRLSPRATGYGPMPSAIADTRAIEPIGLAPNQCRHVWVAFSGMSADRDDRPRSILFELVGSAPADQPLSIDLTRTRWEVNRILGASRVGFGGQFVGGHGNVGEQSSLSVLRAGSAVLAGPLIIDWNWGVAVHFRDREPGSPTGSTITCCDLDLNVHAMLPLVQGRLAAFGPFVGVESMISLGAGHPAFVGPAAGVAVSFSPLEVPPGPFPLVRPRPALGRFTLSLSYVHWLGVGLGGGAPGYAAAADYAWL